MFRFMSGTFPVIPVIVNGGGVYANNSNNKNLWFFLSLWSKKAGHPIQQRNVSGKICGYAVYMPNKANQLEKSGSALALYQVLSIEITTLTQPPIIMVNNTKVLLHSDTELFIKIFGAENVPYFYHVIHVFFPFAVAMSNKEKENEKYLLGSVQTSEVSTDSHIH